MLRFYKPSANDYKLWLSQTIWVNDSSHEERRFVLKGFCDAVIRWMKTKGYTMESRLASELSRWIYMLHVKEFAQHNYGGDVTLPVIKHRNTEEDYDQYYHIMAMDDVYEFMDSWRLVEDMDQDSIVGNRIYSGILDFLYTVIDLEASKQGKLIADFWNDSSDSDEEVRGDNYINDANDGFHGGRGSKV